MRDIGKIIKCMGKGHSLGQMENYIQVILNLGDFSLDKRHGYGIFKWADGKIYEGNWKNGKMNGEGKITFPSKLIKSGIFTNGELTRLKYIDQTSPKSLIHKVKAWR